MRIVATASRRNGAMLGSVVVACALTVLLAATPAFSAPTPSLKTIHVQVNPNQLWTPTGATLHKGDTVTITATGLAHFGTPPIAALPPSGIARGPRCVAVSASQRKAPGGFPAPDLSCWSLIGRIGSWAPFEIGSALTIRATPAGELSVGVNDNYLHDNANGWAVTVRIASPTAPATSTGAKSGSSSKGLVLILAGLGALIVLLVLLLLWRRERKRAASGAKKPVPVPAAAPATAPPAVALQHEYEGERSAGNIVAVTFAGPRALQVGYTYFPDSTDVHVRVVQGATAVTGDFVTEGRDATPHVATVPLEDGLDAVAGAADVTFAWMVGGVAFNYAVRRNPAAEPSSDETPAPPSSI